MDAAYLLNNSIDVNESVPNNSLSQHKPWSAVASSCAYLIMVYLSYPYAMINPFDSVFV